MVSHLHFQGEASVWRSVQAKRSQDELRDRGIIAAKGLVILCVAESARGLPFRVEFSQLF